MGLPSHLKGRFLECQKYRYFADVFFQIVGKHFYKEISKFQQKVCKPVSAICGFAASKN